VTVNEGQTAINTGAFGDPGVDVVSVSADLGTATFTPSTNDGTWSWSYATTDSDQSGVVTITATDSDGASTDTTFDLTVNNVAPEIGILTIASPVFEDSSATLTGSFTDPGTTDVHTLTINWDDGVTQTVTLATGVQTFSITHQYLDDDPSFTPSATLSVAVSVADDDGGVDADSALVQVVNVAPAFTSLTLAPSIDEGGTTTLTGVFTDPGTLDIHTVNITWGDGSFDSFTLPTGDRGFSVGHTFVDDGSSPGNGTSSDVHSVSVGLNDDDTGFVTGSADVTVSNVAPEITDVTLTSPVNEGGTVTLAGSFTDPGILDVHTLDIDWGEGAVQTEIIPLGDRSFSFTHVYLGDNPTATASDAYAVNVTLSDDDGGESSGTGSSSGSGGGDIYLTGHDVLLHSGQSGYDDDILNFLRGSVPDSSYSISVIGSNVGNWSFTGGSYWSPIHTKAGYASTTYYNTSTMTSADWTAALSNNVLVILSPTTCGGCDTSTAGSNVINAHSADIHAAINAGMDLWANSSATLSSYYNCDR